jgi:hypothetical protein
VLRVGRRGFKIDASGCQDAPKESIVVFASSIIAPESLNIITPCIKLMLKQLKCGDAGFRLLIQQKIDEGIPSVVIDEYNKVDCSTLRFGCKGSTGIRVYQFEGSGSPLNWDSDDFPFVLG